MALLVYSDKCTHSKDVLEWLNKHTVVKNIIRLHDVNRQGIPKQYRSTIKSVPTLLTQDGKLLVGAEVIAWMKSILPPQELESMCFGGICTTDLESSDGSSDMFSLDMYGQTIQPAMTPELQEKINTSVTESYQKAQTNK